MKRAFDFAVSLFGLIVLSPLFLIISLGIISDDKSPVLFKQRRVGKDGKLFLLYKFRSMKISESLLQEDFEPGNTSRITKFGRFLRRTKLDELPQLYNVLKGEMSLVGPRPEVEKWINVYPERWKRVLSVKPGLTDNASIEYLNEESLLAGSENPEKSYKEIILPRKLELYKDYVENSSFYNDLKIICKTLLCIIDRK